MKRQGPPPKRGPLGKYKVIQNAKIRRERPKGAPAARLIALCEMQLHCIGSSTAMVVPLSELSSTQTEPPWRLAISHTKESPSPAPPYSRLRDLSTRKKGRKMLCQSSCGMPLGSKGVVQPLRHHSGSPCHRRLRTMVSHRARSSSITKRCMRAFPFISPFLCCFS